MPKVLLSASRLAHLFSRRRSSACIAFSGVSLFFCFGERLLTFSLPERTCTRRSILVSSLFGNRQESEGFTHYFSKSTTLSTYMQTHFARKGFSFLLYKSRVFCLSVFTSISRNSSKVPCERSKSNKLDNFK